MIVEVNGQSWKVEQVTGDVYRAYLPGLDTGVVFTVEHKGGGTYFTYRSSYKNGRNYSAQRFSYKWIPIIREVAFIIAQECGLYDYETGKWYRLIKPAACDNFVFYVMDNQYR